MRELTNFEIQHIAGSGSCIDTALWSRLQDNAINEGLLIGAVASILSTGLIYGVAGSALPALTVGVVIAPYAFTWGYFNSTAWNLVYPAQ